MSRVLSRVLVPGALLLASIASAQPSATGVLNPARSPRNASYSIDARLDPAARTIAGSEIIVWRNITTNPVDDLQVHLYWNAWRDDRSTWMREAALGGTVYRNRREDDRGRIDVTSVTIVTSRPSRPHLVTAASSFPAAARFRWRASESA